MTQLAIPMPAQPRRVKPETRQLYQAILVLRRNGHSVRRAGRTAHIVDGQRLPMKAVKALARTYAGDRA